MLVNQMASGMFRFMASLGRDTVVANTLASFALVVTLVLSGFILSHDKIRAWWIWGYWISPLMYAMNALSINEFLGHKWKHYAEGATEYLGIQVLKNRDLPTEAKWYWIGVGALIGFVIIFNFFFTVALSYLKPAGKAQQSLSEEELKEKHTNVTGEVLDGPRAGEMSEIISASNSDLPIYLRNFEVF